MEKSARSTQAFAPGLEGIVAAQTALSHVDGEAGELIIAGFPVEALALSATFEETLHLLWNGRLPTRDELGSFQRELSNHRDLPGETLALLRKAAERNLDPMDALRMACGSLSLLREATDAARDGSPEQIRKDAALAVGAFPVIVAAYHRMKQGLEPLVPRADLSHAANYLYLLTGQVPTASQVRGIETYLNTVVDHGLNASTFTARVIISTGSDLISAVTGAVGSLKGPLHGGAPGPALDMVFEIGSVDRAEAVLRTKIQSGQRLMGFGHRIYRTRDPRAEVLSVAAKKLFEEGGDLSLYRLACGVEEVALRVLHEYKPERKLSTNVEFYTALLLHGLGLDTSLFTPTFAISRAGGWAAHCLEQMKNNRIFRPQSLYTGAKASKWTPLDAR
jgi:citrate synthase